MPEGCGDLLDELVVQAVDEFAGEILDVADVQILSAAETGKEQLVEIGQDINDGGAAGQRLVTEMADLVAIDVSRDQG